MKCSDLKISKNLLKLKMGKFLAEITHTSSNLTLPRRTPAEGLVPPSHFQIILYNPPTTGALTVNMSTLPGCYRICCRERKFPALFHRTSGWKEQ